MRHAGGCHLGAGLSDELAAVNQDQHAAAAIDGALGDDDATLAFIDLCEPRGRRAECDDDDDDFVIVILLLYHCFRSFECVEYSSLSYIIWSKILN